MATYRSASLPPFLSLPYPRFPPLFPPHFLSLGISLSLSLSLSLFFSSPPSPTPYASDITRHIGLPPSLFPFLSLPLPLLPSPFPPHFVSLPIFSLSTYFSLPPSLTPCAAVVLPVIVNGHLSVCH